MSLDFPSRPMAPEIAITPPVDATIWVHAAFCSMAMPVRSTRGAWQRDIEAGYIRIEPGSSDDVLPSGRIFRLSIMHICDAAFRANSQVVVLGEDAAMLAAALDIEPRTRDLTDQWQRLQASRLLVSAGGAAEISVFDARSRRRAGDAGWRSGVRLSAKFLSSLMDQAVPLNRHVVRELSVTPAALDAYAWISLSLRGATLGHIVTTPWGDLLQRFGTISQGAAEFRSAFEVTLRRVFEVESSVDLAVDDGGVSVRRVAPGDDEIAAVGTTLIQQGADVVAVDAENQRERLTTLPPTTLVVAAAEVATPPDMGPQHLVPQQAGKASQGGTDTASADRITHDNISLQGHLTGLRQVVWLRRGPGEERVLVGVTPTPRFESERLTILAVEPMVIQVSGGLSEKDFERVSAWVMANRDLIDEFWEGRIHSFDEVNRRVRRAPAPGWR